MALHFRLHSYAGVVWDCPPALSAAVQIRRQPCPANHDHHQRTEQYKRPHAVSVDDLEACKGEPGIAVAVRKERKRRIGPFLIR